MALAHFNRWLGAAAILLAVTGTMTAQANDSALITNSGSTNTLGYRIELRPDGSATVAMVRGPSASPSPAKSFTVPSGTAKQFFTDLAAARQAKSASFGSSTYVAWQGWRSPDLSCPPSDATGKALVNDVEEIRKAAGVSAAPLRQGPVELESPGPP
jgi:hypothetical protein